MFLKCQVAVLPVTMCYLPECCAYREGLFQRTGGSRVPRNSLAHGPAIGSVVLPQPGYDVQ